MLSKQVLLRQAFLTWTLLKCNFTPPFLKACCAYSCVYVHINQCIVLHCVNPHLRLYCLHKPSGSVSLWSFFSLSLKLDKKASVGLTE